MNIRTLLGLLVGHRASIVAFAHSPHTPWLGAVAALVMGLARSHAAAALSHHPWRIALFALGVLLGASVLFVLVNEIFGRRDLRVGWGRYPAFVGLVALVALWELPLRLLGLAVPLSEWHVRMTLVLMQLILLARVLLVLTNLGPRNVVGTLLFAGMLHEFGAFVIHEMLNQFPDIGPIWGILGEFPHERHLDRGLVRLVHLSLLSLGGIVFVAGPILAFAGRPPTIWADLARPINTTPTTSLLLAAALGVLVWVPILAATQPAWQRADAIDRALRDRDYATAAALLRSTTRTGLPRPWFLGQGAELHRKFDLYAMPLALWREPLPEWTSREVDDQLTFLFSRTQIGEPSMPKGYDWSRADDAFWFEMYHHPWVSQWLKRPDPNESFGIERANRRWIRDLPKRWAKP